MLLPLHPAIEHNLHRVVSSIAVAKLYTILLSNPEEDLPTSAKSVHDEMAMLQETINLCSTHHHPFAEESKDLWYKRAPLMLPALNPASWETPHGVVHAWVTQ